MKGYGQLSLSSSGMHVDRNPHLGDISVYPPILNARLFIISPRRILKDPEAGMINDQIKRAARLKNPSALLKDSRNVLYVLDSHDDSDLIHGRGAQEFQVIRGSDMKIDSGRTFLRESYEFRSDVGARNDAALLFKGAAHETFSAGEVQYTLAFLNGHHSQKVRFYQIILITTLF